MAFAESVASLSIFNGSIIDAAYFFVMAFVFLYFDNRGYKFDAFEKTLEILIPPMVFAFLCLIAGVPLLIAGTGVFLVYVLSYRHYISPSTKQFYFSSLQLFFLLLFFSFLEEPLRFFLFFLAICFSFIKSEYRIMDSKKSKNSSK